MVKVVPLLLSLASGVFLGIYFSINVNNIFLAILIGIGFFVATLLAIIILFFLLLFLSCFFENKKKERLYQSTYFSKLLHLLELFLFSLFGVKVHHYNLDSLSQNENYIFVCNHRSNLDSLIIDYYTKKFPMSFITKDSLFKVPFVGKIIHGNAYVRLVRDNVMQEYEAFNKANIMLTRENKPLSIGIFPEGTRNKDNDETNLLPFKPGSFRLAKKAKKPIAIFALSKTKNINDNLLFKRHHVYLNLVKILDYEQYEDMSINDIASYCQNKISNYLKGESEK